MPDLQLDTLESKGLIRLATVNPELEYLFRHALVQDAAYESLLKQERRALHRQVGDALEELYPERHGELAAVLARHFEHAGEKDKAVEYLRQAAKFAIERNALVEAYDLYGRAEALLPPPADGDTQALRRLRVEIRFERLRAGFSFLPQGEQQALMEPLVEDVERLDDLRLVADVRMHDAMGRMYAGEDPATSVPLKASLDRVNAIARELNDPVIAALPKSVIGLFQVFTGDLEAGVASLDEAAPLLAQKHDFVGSAFALMALGMGLARLGRFDEAEKASDHAVEVAEQGDVIARIDTLIGRSTIRSIRGDLDAALPIAQQCTEMAQDSGATACVIASSFVTGDALMRQGRFGDAKIVFERGAGMADFANQRMFKPSMSAYLRSAAASLGQFTLDAQSFDEALEESRAMHDPWNEVNVLWKRADTESRKPDADVEQMLSDFATAASMFGEMKARPFHARVLHDWGNALRRLGRYEESDEKLRAALGLFNELGIEREADEVRGELAAAR